MECIDTTNLEQFHNSNKQKTFSTSYKEFFNSQRYWSIKKFIVLHILTASDMCG